MDASTLFFYGFPTALLAFGFVVTFGFPRVPAPRPPYRWHWVLELLFPGTSPAWGALGGVVIAAWIYFFFQLWIYTTSGTPYIIAAIALPNLTRSYGVPMTEADLYSLINPGVLWIYGAPILLFVLNALLVLRSRSKPAPEPAAE